MMLYAVHGWRIIQNESQKHAAHLRNNLFVPLHNLHHTLEYCAKKRTQIGFTFVHASVSLPDRLSLDSSQDYLD